MQICFIFLILPIPNAVIFWRKKKLLIQEVNNKENHFFIVTCPCIIMDTNSIKVVFPMNTKKTPTDTLSFQYVSSTRASDSSLQKIPLYQLKFPH
ncbi:hypothetical protein MANES_14G164150v8 [Manihot esculenta]|uniref:Uncharacterized protein n=1 Tax=Manihot esculenta TaxID=3983 RepID=A0ACB7GIA5_MANES|nr:hypothetical protein MANES_14G164150v8 [Manihot esculenta]